MKRAAIYARISQDREGAGLGVARQEEDCRSLCRRKGWEVVGVYVDNDVSAYSGRRRPEWERLLADVVAGVVDAVAVWHVDRLTRSPAELEHVIALADRHDLELATVTGEVDLATPMGRMVARIVGATARQEVEHESERQRRRSRQAAEAGKVSGGGFRPFGFELDKVTIRPVEAELIREAAGRVLGGESLSSVCRDWAARGINTPTGRHWIPTTLRRLLASARISGRREHAPRVRGGSRPLLGEIVADAVWPAIITPDESDRLRLLLSDPDRRRRAPGTGRTYLLSGILRCGRCGGGLVGRPRGQVPRYVCPNVPGAPTCGGIAVVARRADEHVRDLVLEALASEGLAERVRSRSGVDPELPARIRVDEERLVELARAWADGDLSMVEWRAAKGVLDRRLATSRAALARSAMTSPLDGMVGTYEDLLARWGQMNVSQQRALVGAALDRVVVAPSDPRKRWDPDRFEPAWAA